jgi:hypothetical protein
LEEDDAALLAAIASVKADWKLESSCSLSSGIADSGFVFGVELRTAVTIDTRPSAYRL